MENISPVAVNAQLERILTSPGFSTGERLGQFLSYIVAKALNGHKSELKQYTIAVEALGYSSDFDPHINPSVRILAGRLRRTLDQYYSAQGDSDPIRIDIPKGSYVPVFKTNHPLQERACALGRTEIYSTPRIAVAALENLNENKNQAFLPSGLTVEILNALARFSELSVLGPLNPANIDLTRLYTLQQNHKVHFLLQGWVRSHVLNFR